VIRRVVCAVIVVLIWLIVLAWPADLAWKSPLSPVQRMTLAARDFHVVRGAGVEDGSSLRIGSVGDDGSALQAMPLQHVHADDFSELRYRFNGFPRTLELSFFFRRADSPGDVQPAVTVPWPGVGWQSLDLRKIPGWHGEIIELGFAEYATPQIAPPDAAFQPFRFDTVELWSPSWRGSFANLYTSWFGYTPWALLSISALGPQREVSQAPPLSPFAFLGVVLSLVAATFILGWPRRRIAARVALVFAALWCVLDLIWLFDLHGKHAFTENVYADKPWSEREKLVADPDIAQAAAQVRNYFATRPAPQRILVGAESKYVFLKMIYELLPLNAASIQQLPVSQLSPNGTFVLLFGDTQWRYDEARGTLLDERGAPPGGSADTIYSGAFAHAGRFERVLDSGDLHLYAFRAARTL
jgi:hypothetical protein